MAGRPGTHQLLPSKEVSARWNQQPRPEEKWELNSKGEGIVEVGIVGRVRDRKKKNHSHQANLIAISEVGCVREVALESAGDGCILLHGTPAALTHARLVQAQTQPWQRK